MVRLLILAERLRPRGAEQSGKQGFALFGAAFVDVIDRAKYERGSRPCVQL